METDKTLDFTVEVPREWIYMMMRLRAQHDILLAASRHAILALAHISESGRLYGQAYDLLDAAIANAIVDPGFPMHTDVVSVLHSAPEAAFTREQVNDIARAAADIARAVWANNDSQHPMWAVQEKDVAALAIARSEAKWAQEG
ncbi:MAG: hypothetical protein HY749_16015 [Gammaproteobacteria bacterium]|nr:hypothetical protein [Gammaproteobacteria bacterium]